MIDLKIFEHQRQKNIARCRDRGIVIPTFAEMNDPDLIPDSITKQLSKIGLWDVHPANLFRVTWKNQPVSTGGLFGGVNYIEFPSEITGCSARIIALVGKWFPTGAHKVGATFGCLAPALVTGQFDPTSQKAVWPSTGNYCRGGAYVSSLLACESIALLPEEMSEERFAWLEKVAGEVIATPGCESNVKEIFDMCWELKRTRDDVVVFNQFDEMGNHLWHYTVTGPAMKQVLSDNLAGNDSFAGIVLSSGSAGTLGCADYLKEIFPSLKIAVSEAYQCPTVLLNGFGGHRIEGIGDKHIPWIHNVRNSDMVIAIDDEHPMRLIRLFNEPVGRQLLLREKIAPHLVDQLDLLGISSVSNLLSAIKMAKYYEMGPDEVVLTVFTDSMELYGSRLKQLREHRGEYKAGDAERDFELLQGLGTDTMSELNYYDRKRVHNLKYYTWIEQQQKSLSELNAQWFDHRSYWPAIHDQAGEIDELIRSFNHEVGLL